MIPIVGNMGVTSAQDFIRNIQLFMILVVQFSAINAAMSNADELSHNCPLMLYPIADLVGKIF
jgi:hypothetical protein